MSFSWSELGSSPATPDRSSKKASTSFGLSVDHPSTTPAGPPPPSSVSSAASFTPAGDPSPSFSGSMSYMSNKPKAPNLGKPGLRSSKSSSKGSNVPLGRSVFRGSTRQPSSLSREYHGENGDEENEDEEDEEPHNLPPTHRGTFAMSFDDTTEGEDTEIDNLRAREDDVHEDEDEDGEGEYEDEDVDDDEDYEDDGEEDAEAMMEDGAEYDVEEDLLREIADSGPFQRPRKDSDDSSDLMMLATPAADRRIRREADDIYRASAMRCTTMAQKKELKYALLAKDLCRHTGFAAVSEPDTVLLLTEDIVNRLYDEGVGTEDDEEKLDSTLAQACLRLVNNAWTPHMENLPRARDEHSAKVGPSSHAPAFEKAMYLAQLIFRIHHTPAVATEFGGSRVPLLPEILFRWQEEEHNLDGDQVNDILRYRPSPAAHALFWQAVFSTIVRGNIDGTIQLLRNAAWESVKKSPRGESSYIGQALANIRRVVEDLCQVMEGCPSVRNSNWDIRGSDWTLFRLKAKAAQEALISFAEGKDRPNLASSRFTDSQISHSGGKPSLAGLARKAESQIPWDVYENLQSLYAILTGDPEAILAAAQDWCEATIGLFGWWDDGHNKPNRGLSHSRLASSAYLAAGDEDFFDRLALSLHTVTESDFHFNSADAVEVGVASAFEGNIEGVIGFLRLWSLPIASTVAEIASLGRWLPPPEPQNLINMNDFDMEELEVLGVKRSTGPDDKDGIKDSTLIQYARGLRDHKTITGVTYRGKVSHDGWELAVQVVGRMDSHERSEQIIQELLQTVLNTVDETSRATVDKMSRLLNDLGMVNFAEDTAETFGDILAKDTFRFGEALWYYALAHRPGKVRDVLNTLMSISLVESTVYPADGELDDVLRSLLKQRTATLEMYAKQDLEAAELLGKMLSGYATLRQFYEYRDGTGKPQQKALFRRQQAAAALTAVIASADDNIRGGLYDDSRDAVVSEDFLLALLGEMTVFVGRASPVVTLEQIDTLLKAIEDIQTVGSRVYEVADEFFNVVLASGRGKGSTPASLLGQSTSSLGGSFVMTGSSMIASQLHKSVMKSGAAKGGVKRAWDWRTTVYTAASSGEVLKQLRLGLTKDLANLWLEQADNIIL